VTLFDTAESDGDGESERLLGDLLSRSQARDSIVLATKVSPLGLTRERVRAAAQASLERARHRSYRPLPGFFLAAGVRSAMLARGTDRRLHAAAGLLILAFILFALTDNPIVYTAHFITPLAAILGLSDATYQRKRAHGRGRVATPAPLAPASTASIPELR
jgi:Aldo/keto reductase family